jgi:multidrug resistance efflux pump
MSSAYSVRQVIRNRLVRVMLALALVGFSVWGFLPYVAYRIAPMAFVNAELVRVVAPIPGRLSRHLPRKGDFIEELVTVSLITSLSTDRRHLLNLEREYAVAEEHAALARKQLEEVAVASDELQRRVISFREGTIKRLGDEITETQTEKDGCLAEANQRQDVESRMELLVAHGNTSEIRTSESRAMREAITTRCAVDEAHLKRLQDELASAQQGIFVRDGANDVPYSQQQRDRLLVRRQELETLALDGGARSRQLAGEIADEKGRIDQLDHSDLLLPQNHLVWSVSASPGSAVIEGQTLLDLADCAHLFLAVQLPERDFEQIKGGDPAYVRLIGSDDWTLGEVRQVRGSAARTDDRLLAAQIPSPDGGKITVEVGLPRGAALADRNSFCNIGRLAEVRFDRVRFGFFDGLRKALGWHDQRLDEVAVSKSVTDH